MERRHSGAQCGSVAPGLQPEFHPGFHPGYCSAPKRHNCVRLRVPTPPTAQRLAPIDRLERWLGGDRMTSALTAQHIVAAKRILVVEDEMMIRMLLEDMLGELGYMVAAEAARVDEALHAARNAEFDIAILDVNLNGQPVSPVADALVARGTPFVFATGYGERSLPDCYRDRPILRKPFQIEGLKQMLQSVIRSQESGVRTLDASHRLLPDA
jgi:CheY-like chemotaxis protein